MPLKSPHIQYRYSGKATKNNPDISLGGAINNEQDGLIKDDVVNSLIGDITGNENEIGITIYRGAYIKNIHTSLTWIDFGIYLLPQMSSGDVTFEVGITNNPGQQLQEIHDEQTPPDDVTFYTPSNPAAALKLGDLLPNGIKGFWIKHTVNPGIPAVNSICKIATKGDTNP